MKATHIAVTNGQCEHCHHHGKDCTGYRGNNPKTLAKLEAEDLLSRVAEAQQEFWDLLSELESVLGVDIDCTVELALRSVQDLKKAGKAQ